jgi:hypothetical protein
MLSRRLGESSLRNSMNGDEQHHNANTSLTRSKSLRLNKTPIKLNTIGKPQRNELLDNAGSLVDSTSKLETNEPYSNINYWKPNETTTNTLISDVGGANLNELQSGRNSFILSRKNSRSIEFLNFNHKAGAKLQKFANNNTTIGNNNNNTNNNSNDAKGLNLDENGNKKVTNSAAATATPQLNKLGQFAIETQ